MSTFCLIAYIPCIILVIWLLIEFRKFIIVSKRLKNAEKAWDKLIDKRSRQRSKERFIETIQTIPPSVFRIKGIVEFIGADKPLLFQYVGGRFEFSEFNNPKMTDRFIILIGQDIQKESMASLFSDRIFSNILPH